MTRGTNNPRKAEERTGEDWRGIEARPLSPWPLPPLHSGSVGPGAHSLPVTYTHTHHTFAHVGPATTHREKGPQER